MEKEQKQKQKNEPCGNKAHEYDTRDRFNYLKEKSANVSDFLEASQFAVNCDELQVFMKLLQTELYFKFGFKDREPIP